MVLKPNRNPDLNIRKFKASYSEREDEQNILSPEPLNSYHPVVQGGTVRLMLVFAVYSIFTESMD